MRNRHILVAAMIVGVLFFAFGAPSSYAQQEVVQKTPVDIRTVPSKDGTQIHYAVHGDKGPFLVFVHGWSCDKTYWREQVGYFNDKYRLVLLDLAGHGLSGDQRKDYTVEAFGQDVKAVVDDLAAEKVILIGHSMGALVVAEAARLMPEMVAGIIAVDDFQNVEYTLGDEQFQEMVAPLEKGFEQGVKDFVATMQRPEQPGINAWIASDMSKADPQIALSALRNTLGLYRTGEAMKIVEDLNVPVIAVNADLWPTDVEANERHIKDFTLIELEGLDHFLMLNAPEVFNPALERAIEMLLSAQ